MKHRGLQHQGAGHGAGRGQRADNADNVARRQRHCHRNIAQRLKRLQCFECLRRGGALAVHLERRRVGHVGGADAEPHGVGIAAATLPAAQRRGLGASHQLGQVGDQRHPPAALGRPLRRQGGHEPPHLVGHLLTGPLMGTGRPPAPLQPGADRDQWAQGREHGHERVPHQSQHQPGHHRQGDSCPRQGIGLRPGRRLRGHPQRRRRGRGPAARRAVERDPSRGCSQPGAHGRRSVVHRDPPLETGGTESDGGSGRHRCRGGRGASRHDRAVARAEVGDDRSPTGPVRAHPGMAARDCGVVEHHVATLRATDHPGAPRGRREAGARSQACRHHQHPAGTRSRGWRPGLLMR